MTNTIDLLLRALDAALDVRKIAFAFGATLLMVMVVGGISVIGGLLGAFSANSTALAVFVGLFLLLAWIVGTALGGLVQGGLSAMSLAQLSGAPPVGVRAAARYALRRALGFGTAPFAPLLVTLGVVLAEVVVMLPGRFPVVGGVWSALLFYPLLFVNLLVALGLLVGGLLLYPAIVSGDKSLPVAVREVVSLLRRSPMRIITAVTLALLAYTLAFFLLVVLLFLAVSLTSLATTIGAGAIPGISAFQPEISPFGEPDVRIVPTGAGDVLFLAASLLVYGLLLAFSITLFNALGAAIYLGVAGQPAFVAPTPATQTPTVPVEPLRPITGPLDPNAAG